MRILPGAVLFALAVVAPATAFAAPATIPPCTDDVRPPAWIHPEPWNPCGGDSVSFVAVACGPCATITGVEQPSTGPFRVYLSASRGCTERADFRCAPDSVMVPLGRMLAGHYTLTADLITTWTLVDGSLCTTTHHDTISFDVRRDCGSPPPPPPGNELPYVEHLCIGPAPPTTHPCGPPICPMRPIQFHVDGHMVCARFRGIRVDYIRTDVPPSPVVHLLVQKICPDRPCPDVITPWQAEAIIDGRPPGNHLLPVVMDFGNDCDTTAIDSSRAVRIAYTVAESCDVEPQQSCFTERWEGSDSRCNATLGADRSANVTMDISSGAPLGGLQGSLLIYPPGLAITALRPATDDPRLHLVWHGMPYGADFVMFSERGSIVPGGNAATAALRVTLAAPAGMSPPDVTYLTANNLTASDTTGVAVLSCPAKSMNPERFVAPAAQICNEKICDFNGDGSSDVRDLVQMVHCILGIGTCTVDSTVNMDCNGDSTLTIDDVLCCARHILRGDMPDTTHRRPEPGVHATFGTPVRTATGLDIPLRLEGADLLGAARLALNYARDRFTSVSVELAQATPAWLLIQDEDGQGTVFGLVYTLPVRLARATDGLHDLNLIIHLVLAPGRQPGGIVSLTNGQFSDPTGAALDVTLGQPVVTLPRTARVTLTAAMPNPFSREMKFRVTLDGAANVEVEVHDLSGRRVTALHRGMLPGGDHDFTWDGTRSDGSPAPEGLYFYRARAGDEQAARKVALRRGK